MTSFLLCWTLLLCTTFKSYTSLLITKQATLTPNTTSQNGATITVLNATIDWDPVEWELYDGAINEHFHLLLTLDTSWGFHPIERSKLTIQVNADTNTGNPGGNYHDLMVAFTQSPFNTYFATAISMSPYGTDHKMYPYWQQTQPFPSFANGNVKTIVDTGIGGWTRFTKASNNNQYQWWTPYISSGRYVAAPLTFALENRPASKDNYMLFTYINPGTAERWCGYAVMSPNTEINIYFAADGYYDSVDISSITVTLNYTITDAPTYNPTTAPTINPTNKPTVFTSEPTIMPTIQPTFQPTYVPTYIPTINPTTIPTYIPTYIPSLSPSTMTNNPSHSPTNNPTNNPTKPQSVVDDDDVSTTLVSDGGEQINGGDGDVNNANLYIIIGTICVVVMVIIVSIIIILKRRRNKENKNEQKASSISHGEVVKHDNMMVQMVVKPDVDIEDDGAYKVQSTEMIPVTTPKSDDTESILFNGNHIENNNDNDNAADEEEEEGDNKDTEAMYDNIAPMETAGNEMITDKGDLDVMTPCNVDQNVNIECRDEVKQWLRETVELQQYYDIFVKNGLDSLTLIAKLNGNDEALIDLGIELKGHRIILMKYIKQLNIEGAKV